MYMFLPYFFKIIPCFMPRNKVIAGGKSCLELFYVRVVAKLGGHIWQNICTHHFFPHSLFSVILTHAYFEFIYYINTCLLYRVLFLVASHFYNFTNIPFKK